MTDIVVTLPHIEGFFLFVFLSFVGTKFYYWYQDYLYKKRIKDNLRCIILGTYVGGLVSVLSGGIFNFEDTLCTRINRIRRRVNETQYRSYSPHLYNNTSNDNGNRNDNCDDNSDN